jgi:predicted Zn-dependent protease
MATSDDFTPNYAGKLLPPVEGTHLTPSICAARSIFPLRVVVLDNFYYSDPYFSAIKEACEAWAKATENVRGGGCKLSCQDVDNPTGADVVIRLCSRDGASGFDGFTDEFGAFAYIRLSVTDIEGKRFSPKALKLIAMHEFGHALGIWGHSPNPNDIMSENPTDAHISISDVNTLRLAYSGRFPSPWRPSR